MPHCDPGDNAATAMKSVVVDPSATTGKETRRCATRCRARSSTRCTCADSRAIRAPASRGDARHLCRPDREDPLSAGARHHGRRTVAGVPVRRAGLPARPRELLGLFARLVLRARTRRTARARTRSARSTSFATWSRRCIARASKSSSTSCSTTRPRAVTSGPTLCFRGLDNPTYYILEEDRARYANYSGSGNTLNANHPIVRRLIVDSLRYWVEQMHVDGFRFDLASILARDAYGTSVDESAGAVGHRIRPGAGRHEAHCRGVGCRRAVPGRQLHRRQLERMERPISATMFAASSAATTGSVARVRRPPGRQPRDLRPRRARAGAEHQLRDLPRRLHAQRSRLLQPQTQRGERRETTATARTTTSAGTAASKVRPTIPTSRICATAGEELLRRRRARRSACP